MSRMKIKKKLAVMLMLLSLVFSFSGTMAFAAKSDVDFTISVADDLQYMSGNTIQVPIIIKTQTDNGYVDLTMFLTFDPDYLTCATILETEVDGFTTHLYDRESDGAHGLMINYSSPDGKKSQKDTQLVFTVEFSVKTGVASTETCLLHLEVNKDDVFGLDSNGNKEKGLLTVSAAKDKNLQIVETNEDAATTSPDEGDEPNFFISTTSPNPDDPANKQRGGCSAGGVIGIIVGAFVVFAAGVVVGSIWCQKRLNEDGYDVPAFSFGSSFSSLTRGRTVDSREPERTYEDVAEQYRRSTGRTSSIYDDEIYSQRPAAPKPRRSFEDDDSMVDTDYFGRASDVRLGSDVNSGPMLYDDDEDDEDEFPSELAPRNGNTQENRFGDFGFIGGNRRQRNDDGYGAFQSDDDDDDDNGGGYDYRSDRRRYR